MQGPGLFRQEKHALTSTCASDSAIVVLRDQNAKAYGVFLIQTSLSYTTSKLWRFVDSEHSLITSPSLTPARVPCGRGNWAVPVSLSASSGA